VLDLVFRNVHYLIDGFILAKNDFGMALSDAAMVVDSGKIQIVECHAAKLPYRLFH
jgi:hypothetical protein